MKGNIAVIMVSMVLLLTLLLFGWSLRQRSTYAPIAFDDVKLRNKANSGLLTTAFDENKCVSQLNADSKKKLDIFGGQGCFLFPLNNEKMGDADVMSDFCTPFMKKYVIAKPANECKQDGYWVYDPIGCMRQFVPIKNEKDLKALMDNPTIWFSKSRPVGKDDLRLVFFSDSCNVNEEEQELLYALSKKGQKFAYRHTPGRMAFGLYDGNFASIACRNS